VIGNEEHATYGLVEERESGPVRDAVHVAGTRVKRLAHEVAAADVYEFVRVIPDPNGRAA